MKVAIYLKGGQLLEIEAEFFFVKKDEQGRIEGFKYRNTAPGINFLDPEEVSAVVTL